MRLSGRWRAMAIDRWSATGVRWTYLYPTASFICSNCRHQSTATAAQPPSPPAESHKPAPAPFPPLIINDKSYRTDSWTNVPQSILSALPRRLHLLPHHPIALTRLLIESHFPSPTYIHYDKLPPVVSVAQNFDSLGFPLEHPGRSRTDTYYINATTCLRTHTSAHQADTFHLNQSDGYTISADVYRRDAIDRSHYPIFHQMEGARLWDRRRVPDGDIAKAVWADVERLPKHDVVVEDANPTIHPERNPLQANHHTAEEVEAIAAHLKRSLEGVVVDIFAKAREAALSSSSSAAHPSGSDPAPTPEPLRVRWIEAYFPFTSPSWELEVLWRGSWLELLGCGIVAQPILSSAGCAHKLGWAFGVGLERVAMLLYSIPDIRLFWSADKRFLSQFSANRPITPFVPFSKFPACPKDVAFWVSSTNSTSSTNTTNSTSNPNPPSNATAPPPPPFHENDLMEIVRDAAGDAVEDVRLVDSFQHPTTGRRSLCYRIHYRSLERTLTNEEANGMHAEVRRGLVERLGVELR